MLLSGQTMGADGAIGSSYNAMADLYTQVLEDFWCGEVKGAKDKMLASNDILQILQTRDYSASLRAAFAIMGIDAGFNPSPASPVDETLMSALKGELSEYATHSDIQGVRLLDAVRP